MWRRRVTIVTGLIVLLGCATFGASLFYGTSEYIVLKRNVRLALGLPKFWVTNFNNATNGYEPRACPKDPIVLVSGGQSNAANSYDFAPPADDNPNTYMFFSGRCFKLRSPVLGATGDRDSLWPRLADRINHLTGRPVIFINGAAGGTQIGDWLDDRSGYFKRLAGNIALAEKVGLQPQLVFWIQGETDASVEIDPATYVREQRALIDKFDAAGVTRPETPWMIYLSTHCMHRTTNGPQIEAALRRFIGGDNGRTFLGPEMSSYDDNYRHDTCHLNTRGRDRLVDETMAILRSADLLSASRSSGDAKPPKT